jgi:hypothetical protein
MDTPVRRNDLRRQNEIDRRFELLSGRNAAGLADGAQRVCAVAVEAGDDNGESLTSRLSSANMRFYLRFGP